MSGQGQLRHTPLEAAHRALGASLTGFAGWSMPLRYGSETAEHRAVRSAAGLFDLSHMGEITVKGADAPEMLDYALVGFMSAVPVGRARYTLMCDADGGVMDDLIAYRRADDEYLVVANASNAELVLAELNARAGTHQVTIRDDTDDYALIAVQGPAAVAVLASLTDDPLGDMPYYSCLSGAVAGRGVLFARTGYTGEDGFELFVRSGDANDVWQELLDAGAPHSLTPAGLSARDTLRLEAGMPLYGQELTRDRTPYDAGLGRSVRIDKPSDFVGRAALQARSAAPPAHVLVGLSTAGGRVPRPGHRVHRPGSDAPCGVVTSGAPSPTLRRNIAMAYVPPALSEPGTPVCVDVRGNLVTAEVVPLPFYKRERSMEAK